MLPQIQRETILLARGNPAVEALPNMLLSECMQAVLEGADAKTILQYGHSGGYAPLRQLLAERYQVSSDQVLIGSGSLHFQDLLASLFIKSGDVILVEQPSYGPAISTFRRHGAKVIGIPLEKDGVNLLALEKALAQKTPVFMYVIPDFHNPTGFTTSAEKRQALVDLAQRHDFWLIEDVHFRLLRYAGKAIPLLRDFQTERVITIDSYSKVLSPALRVGYLVGPAELVQSVINLVENTVLMPVLPSQAAVLEFHRRGYFEPHLASLKQLYAPRLQAMVTALKTYLPKIDFFEPEGGFFVSFMLPSAPSRSHFPTRAKHAGLVLLDGREFFADPLDESEQQASLGERFIQLPFCELPPAQLEEGVRCLAKLLKAEFVEKNNS